MFRRARFLMLLVCSLGFATSRNTARALSLPHHTRHILQQRKVASTTCLYSASQQEPRTGWPHNQPQEGTTQSSPTPAPTNKEARTGWLHNTAPKQAPAVSTADASSGSQAQKQLKAAMKQREENHRILCAPIFHAIRNDDGPIMVTEHQISLPIDRSNAESKRVDVHFSIVEKMKDKDELWWKSLTSMDPNQRAVAYVERVALKNANDIMLYLQGGPGFGAPTPVVGIGLTKDGSWAGKALETYERIVLMDQRGTGRSTPITKQRLEKMFPDLFLLDAQTAESLAPLSDYSNSSSLYERVKPALEEATHYMTQFRADNIVLDAEAIKDALLLPLADDQQEEHRPYGCALGQSFGGFCMMTYLSQVAHPPRICLLTGGIAPMLSPIYDVYSTLWERVKERNLRYYEMFPDDVKMVKRIVHALLQEPATLPSGSKLTARRFLQLGMALGSSPSSFARVHSLTNSAFLHPEDSGDFEFTRSFLKQLDSEQPFDDAPIYFLLHESIYADGTTKSPTNWAAHRAFEAKVKNPSEFDYRLTSSLDSNDRPVLFFGEMVFPWMADGDYNEVSGLGMRSLAHELATKDDWGPLFDPNHMRQVLADGSISKAAAAVYYEDLYVDFDASMKVASRGGPLEKCKVWVSNEYQHSGLRDNGAAIFSKLHGMATGKIRTPS